MKPFIPKQVQGIPDHYGLKVCHLTGKVSEVECVSQMIINNGEILSVLTAEDKYVWLPLSGIEKVEFDLRFTKLMELQRQNERQSA